MALAFGPAEEFALVLLAFTTFVGLGGDDILKTIVMICLGLVLSTVGLDLISGQPRLIFGDLPGFYSGISFLVLAIGVYGVGEVLYTIETSKSNPTVSNAKITFKDLYTGIKTISSYTKTMSIGSFWASLWVCFLRLVHTRIFDGLWLSKQTSKNLKLLVTVILKA